MGKILLPELQMETDSGSARASTVLSPPPTGLTSMFQLFIVAHPTTIAAGIPSVCKIAIPKRDRTQAELEVEHSPESSKSFIGNKNAWWTEKEELSKMYNDFICLNLYLFICFALIIQLSKQAEPKSSTDKKGDKVEIAPKKECKWHLDKTKPLPQEKKKSYSKDMVSDWFEGEEVQNTLVKLLQPGDLLEEKVDWDVNHFMFYIGTVDDELAKQNAKPFDDSVKKEDRNKHMYIHFTHLNDGEVKMHSLVNTKTNSPLRKNNLTEWQMPSFPPKDALKRAINQLGCRIKFETATRNCQHFVFTIKHGVSFSPIAEGYSCFNKDKFRNHSFHNVLPGSSDLKQLYSTKDAPPKSVFIQVHGESWANVIEDYMPTLVIDTQTNTVDFSVVPPDAWDLNLALLNFIHEKVREVWASKLTNTKQIMKEPALRNALNALTVLEWNFLVQQMYTLVEVALELQSTILKPLKNTYPQLTFDKSKSFVNALKACHKYWDMSGVDKKLKQVLKNLVGEAQSNSLKYPLSGMQYIVTNQADVIEESKSKT